MFKIVFLFYLLSVIKTINSHLFYDPEYFFFGRNEISTLYNPKKYQEENPIQSYSDTEDNNKGRKGRSVESVTELVGNDIAITQTNNNCTPSTPTTKAPLNFFFTIGSPNYFPDKKNFHEDKYDKNDGDDEDTADGPPCDYYPHSPPKFPFHGGLGFGDTNMHNPFLHSPMNNDKHDNPMFRGGAMFGTVPNNPFVSNKDKEGRKKSNKDAPTVNMANFWCSKYQSRCRSKDEDSDLKPRIIGGTPASPRKHTHMVMIGYGTTEEKHWLCGGSLISSKHVLSAAHCTTAGNWGKPKWARLGDLDLSTRSEDASPQERFIVKHYNHPDYKEPAVYHDIAVYKLDEDVIYTAWVSPICLHTTKEITSNQVTVTGWGRTAFASDTSPILMEVEIGLYNDSECKKLIDQNTGNRLPTGIDSRIMVCAGVKQGGKDACSGDSGGPLIIETSKCSKVQVGITSIGRDCGLPDTPGVYTRIFPYIPWIESMVWS